MEREYIKVIIDGQPAALSKSHIVSLRYLDSTTSMIDMLDGKSRQVRGTVQQLAETIWKDSTEQ